MEGPNMKNMATTRKYFRRESIFLFGYWFSLIVSGMTKDEILARMDDLGFTRQTLAAATGYKYEYVRDRLTPTASEPSPKFIAAVERAFSEQERRREVDLTKPGASVWDLVYFNGLEVERIDRAKKAGGYSDLPSFYRDAVIEFADGILKKEAAPEPANVTLISKREQIANADPVGPFPEIPLLRAAAGLPILADAEMVEPDRKVGDGRFLLELRGDSMEPFFHDRQRVILRDKTTLKRPLLKYGDFYCFVHEGAATFKQWAKDSQGNKVLRSLNPEHRDIPVAEDTDWIGWYDLKDNE